MLLVIANILLIIFIFMLRHRIIELRKRILFSQLDIIIILLFLILTGMLIAWFILCIYTLKYIQVKDIPISTISSQIQSFILDGNIDTIEEFEETMYQYQECQSNLKLIVFFQEHYTTIRWWLDLNIL